jgi:tetraacyldisaccharide 4'-kinase
MSGFKLRTLLWPLGLLFGAVVALRRWLYQWGIFKRYQPPVATIAVGNLSTGGTGKTPLVIDLVQQLHKTRRVATLSRGYGRTTQGFRWVQAGDSSLQVGDEPLLIRQAVPAEVRVAVGENRPLAIQTMLRDAPDLDLVVLDDAYQHLALQARLYILTTPWNKTYGRDLLLPAGNLREPRSAARHAPLIVVTKCPPQLTHAQAGDARRALKVLPHQTVCFTGLDYGAPLVLNHGSFDPTLPFVLMTGIADPSPLIQHLNQAGRTFDVKAFPDHHELSSADVQQLEAQARRLYPQHPQILTTEKDAVRSARWIKASPVTWAAQPIQLTWLLQSETAFHAVVEGYLVGR